MNEAKQEFAALDQSKQRGWYLERGHARNRRFCWSLWSGVVREDVEAMAKDPIVFAMSNPTPKVPLKKPRCGSSHGYGPQ